MLARSDLGRVEGRGRWTRRRGILRRVLVGRLVGVAVGRSVHRRAVGIAARSDRRAGKHALLPVLRVLTVLSLALHRDRLSVLLPCALASAADQGACDVRAWPARDVPMIPMRIRPALRAISKNPGRQDEHSTANRDSDSSSSAEAAAVAVTARAVRKAARSDDALEEAVRCELSSV